MIYLVLRDVDTKTSENRILSPYVPRVGERIITDTEIYEVKKVEYVVRDKDWLYTGTGNYARHIKGVECVQIDVKRVRPGS